MLDISILKIVLAFYYIAKNYLTLSYTRFLQYYGLFHTFTLSLTVLLIILQYLTLVFTVLLIIFICLIATGSFHGRGGPIGVRMKGSKPFLDAGLELGYNIVDPVGRDQIGEARAMGYGQNMGGYTYSIQGYLGAV